jgi:hypothetical protein
MSDTKVWFTPLSSTDRVKLNAVATTNPAPSESIINFQTIWAVSSNCPNFPNRGSPIVNSLLTWSGFGDHVPVQDMG